MPVTFRQWEESLRQPALCELLPVRDYLDGCIIRTNGCFVAGYDVRGLNTFFHADETRNRTKELLEALVRSLPERSMRMNMLGAAQFRIALPFLLLAVYAEPVLAGTGGCVAATDDAVTFHGNEDIVISISHAMRFTEGNRQGRERRSFEPCLDRGLRSSRSSIEGRPACPRDTAPNFSLHY